LNSNSDTEAPLGWSNGFYQTSLQYDPNNITPSTKSYISYTDSFTISGAATGAIKVVLTGGTYDGSTWAGNYTAQVVLTYIEN
jgi:hypothetical protein